MFVFCDIDDHLNVIAWCSLTVLGNEGVGVHPPLYQSRLFFTLKGVAYRQQRSATGTFVALSTSQIYINTGFWIPLRHYYKYTTRAIVYVLARAKSCFILIGHLIYSCKQLEIPYN